MDDCIEFNRAAFKHGVTTIDILCAAKTFLYEEPVENEVNKNLLIGFNSHGNLIEVMYNRIDENTVNVFHAMPCRPELLKLIP
jgi:hypothetical protein